MLDSEYLNDLWKQVNVEDPDRIPAEDVKKILEELSELRKVREAPASIQADCVVVERTLFRVGEMMEGIDRLNTKVDTGFTPFKSPLTTMIGEAREAILRMQRAVHRLRHNPGSEDES